MELTDDITETRQVSLANFSDIFQPTVYGRSTFAFAKKRRTPMFKQLKTSPFDAENQDTTNSSVFDSPGDDSGQSSSFDSSNPFGPDTLG